MVWTLKKPKPCLLKGSTLMIPRSSRRENLSDGNYRLVREHRARATGVRALCPRNSKGPKIADFRKSTACTVGGSLVQS